jgi:hypothetical protein
VKKAICTTTINPPSEALLKFASLKDWDLIVALDMNSKVFNLPGSTVLSVEDQKLMAPELSAAIGFKSIQRRNFATLYALREGYEKIAFVDDDNIPYDNWGLSIKVGEDVTYKAYQSRRSAYFDPLAVTTDNYVWHRGYPIQHLQTRHDVEFLGYRTKRCLVQANLWDGDPDIDAMARLTHKPCVDYRDITGPYGSSQLAPFNSQNTFIAREAIPFYSVLPFVGRMDDIWGSYILQHHFPDSVIYDVATVYQDRNIQDLVTNLENEIIGYRNTLGFVEAGGDYEKFFPEGTLKFWHCYRDQFTTK